MLTVVETPMFLRYAASVWGDDEREGVHRLDRAEPGSRGCHPWRHAST